MYSICVLQNRTIEGTALLVLQIQLLSHIQLTFFELFLLGIFPENISCNPTC